MKLQDFISEFEEILMVESGTISMDTQLNEIQEWDSLTKIALDLLLEEKFNIKIEIKTLDEFETFADIVNVIKNQLEE